MPESLIDVWTSGALAVQTFNAPGLSRQHVTDVDGLIKID
jgi:hypothetical protein